MVNHVEAVLLCLVARDEVLSVGFAMVFSTFGRGISATVFYEQSADKGGVG